MGKIKRMISNTVKKPSRIAKRKTWKIITKNQQSISSLKTDLSPSDRKTPKNTNPFRQVLQWREEFDPESKSTAEGE